MSPNKWIRKPQAETSVVFVHGVLSNGETCWLHNNGSYWPKLLEDEPDLNSLGIYVFTYQTGFFSGSYSLGDTVNELKVNMDVDGVLQSKRLIFVCHSMGGIVVRKFLVERTVSLIETKKEIGLFLVASPSLGAKYADWLSPLARFLGHAQADALRFVSGNYWLQDLDREFINLKESGNLKIKGQELVEDKFIVLKKLGIRQVVEPISGARYFGEPFRVPRSDHLSIAKPENSQAIQHRLLCKFIKNMLTPSTRTIDSTETIDTVTIPKLEVDWPYSKIPQDGLRAFIAEATYRAEHLKKPWFQLSLLPLQVAKTQFSDIEQQFEYTNEDRKKRIELLQNIEYFENIQKYLTNCFTLILSGELRKRVGWGLMSNEKMVLVLDELLQEPDKTNIRVLLINHTAQLQARLYVDRHRLEQIFKCKLVNSDSFLSIIDCPLPIEVAGSDWDTMWRSFGAILRTVVVNGIDPTANIEAIHMKNWILSGD